MPPTRHPSSKRGLFYGLVELGREWLIGTGLRAGTSSAPSLLILFVHDGIIGGEEDIRIDKYFLLWSCLFVYVDEYRCTAKGHGNALCAGIERSFWIDVISRERAEYVREG